MDIELLSKMVKELILDNDKVYLPGLGAFVAEVAPSTFSDRGYTINPPYRKLSFRSSAEKDDLLSTFYASQNNIEPKVAERILESFSGDLSAALQANRAVQIPGLGRMRLGRDGNIFFIADEELDVYPIGFGLEPISLKTHQKPSSFDFSTLDVPVPTPEPNALAVEVVVPAAFSGAAEAVPEIEHTSEPANDPQPVAEPEVSVEPEPSVAIKGEKDYFVQEPEEEELEPELEEERESVFRSFVREHKGLVASLIILLTVILVVVVGFIILKDFFPDTLDRMLYTKEELEILNYYK